jgi:polysaccharide biosynthesis protein PslA
MMAKMNLPKRDLPEASTAAVSVIIPPPAKKTERHRRASDTSPLTSELRQSLQRRRGSRSLVAAQLMCSDLISSTLAFAFANFVYLGNISWQYSGNMLAVCLPMFLLFAINNNAHNAKYVLQFWSGVARALTALGFAGICLLLVLFFLKVGAEYSRGVVLIGGLTCLIALPGGRALVRLLTERRVRDGLYAEICIYDGVPVKPISGMVVLDAKKFGLVPQLDSAETIGRLGELVKGLDRVVVHSCPENRADWAVALKALDIPCQIVLPELDQYNGLSISRFGANNALLVTTGKLKWNQSLIKRAFDIAVSAPALIILLPLFFAVAIAIKVDSRGPVLFRQERIGLGNRRFNLLKFRSMYHELSDHHGDQSTKRGDSRITKVGAFIRRTSLDELPQLVNVLIGDMSLVGPRPHATGSRAGGLLFWEVDSAYWNRHVVKPGITGLAQIRGHRGNTFHEDDLQKRLDADLLYVENWSFLGDVRILLKTFSVISHSNAF